VGLDPTRSVEFSFVGLLPRKVGAEIAAWAGVDRGAAVGSVGAEERRRLAATLHRLELPVDGLGPMQQAEVASGGVSTDELSSKSMESRLVPGCSWPARCST